MPGCKPPSTLTRPLMAGVFTLVLPLLLARPAAAQMSSAECGTDNLIAGRMPSAQQDAHGDVRLVTDGKAAPEGAQWDAPGPAMFLDTPAGTLTYDLGVVRSVSAFLLQADANDSYKVFGATREHAVGVQAAHRDRQRRQRRPRPAHAPGADRADGGPLRPDRRAAGRQLVLDLRVPGLLPGAQSVPAQAADRRRAARRR